MKDYYKTLKIKQNSTETEIKKAFRTLAIKYHPDKNEGDSNFTKFFIEIKEAYDILIDKEKRKEFDLKYNSYYGAEQSESGKSENSKTYKQPENEKQQERKTTVNNEEFNYEPINIFFTEKERENQQTFHIKPIYDIYNKIIPDKITFFKYPNKIGKILYGYSDFSEIPEKDVPISAKLKIIKNLVGIGIGIGIGLILYLIGNPNPTWTVIFFITPIIIMLVLFNKKDDSTPEFVNFFVCMNGFAKYNSVGSIDNLTASDEINFNEVTDLYLYYEPQFDKSKYIGSQFLFAFLDATNQKIKFIEKGFFISDDKANLFNRDITFYQKIEKYWTIYQLDQMEKKLQTYGFLTFNLYSHEKNIHIPYIKLGIGFITFIKENNDFTYNFNDIKKIYMKDNCLHIQHKNFDRTLYFFKSGNEDVIFIKHLCNLQFFYKSMELLLGVKL